jgi:hypothetical protein
MTSGPAAHLGGILRVPFPRPRERHAVLEHADYYALREELIGFLGAEGGRTPGGDALEVETVNHEKEAVA